MGSVWVRVRVIKVRFKVEKGYRSGYGSDTVLCRTRVESFIKIRTASKIIRIYVVRRSIKIP